MKKCVLFSIISALSLTFSSCAMLNKKEEPKKEETQKKPSEGPSKDRRYKS